MQSTLEESFPPLVKVPWHCHRELERETLKPVDKGLPVAAGLSASAMVCKKGARKMASWGQGFAVGLCRRWPNKKKLQSRGSKILVDWLL